MLKFFSLFSCWLLFSGSISQALPAAFPDTPTITANSVGKARIGMAVSKVKELYKNCAFTPVHLGQFGFDDYGTKRNVMAVSYNRQRLFVFFPVEQASKVAGFFVFHPSYLTAEGIHVGSTSGQLKTLFPAMRVVPNMMMQEIQMAFSGEVGKPGIEYAFFKQGHVGNYIIADEPVKISATNSKVSWIQIFPNP